MVNVIVKLLKRFKQSLNVGHHGNAGSIGLEESGWGIGEVTYLCCLDLLGFLYFVDTHFLHFLLFWHLVSTVVLVEGV